MAPVLSIALQPHVEMEAKSSVNPSVICLLKAESFDPAVYYFAMAVVVDDDNEVVDGSLHGMCTVQGQQLQLPTGPVVVFNFSDMSICYNGTCKLRLDAYEVSNADAKGATLVSQAFSKPVNVHPTPEKDNNGVIHLLSLPEWIPTEEERALIAMLHNHGVEVAL
ncbi:hypothetical protein B0I35DRAFT_474145 [Stachybotrys elegans]|uniref:Velvet domain-containing protein n=1 Tax=Stachybotrys elegans TaxID=80388 RepID=A0A8K0T687_9HYPO|nr:hypothetical protein B0I35DRAFT_474145 [Stachybotrys elegans]